METDPSRPTVIIVGAGFGGMNAARALRRAPVNVILIDKNNYHLFQPLLYQVATAGLSPTDIAYPVRAIFRKQKNFSFRLAEVTGVDVHRRLVTTNYEALPYDYLILAAGGETNFFGIESVMENAYDLKNLQDAIDIRNHILSMFELASQIQDQTACQALRTFVIVGGGPTGVESAGALSELIRLVLRKDFPNLDFSNVRVIILEAMDRLLAGFPEDLGEAALRTLRQKRVEVRFGAQVSSYDGREVLLTNGESVQACTLIWAAGVRAAGMLSWLGLPQAKGGRVMVEPSLQTPDYPEVFVIGDAAYQEAEGDPLPMVAPVAIQQGKTAARNIERLIAGEAPLPFEYKDPGSLATIGRNAAVARVGRLKFSGFIAWVVWLVVHLYWLIGFRNRLLVMINWAWDYFFFDRGVRLITRRQSMELEEVREQQSRIS